MSDTPLTRRALLKRGVLGVAGMAAAGTALAQVETAGTALAQVDTAGSAHAHVETAGTHLPQQVEPGSHSDPMMHDDGAHDPDLSSTVGRILNPSIDPMMFLEHFDYGQVSRLADGRVLREYRISAVDREIEVAPGVMYMAWTYNGQVPGPTLRATEGDVVRVYFTNAGSHAHTIHFHGIHAAGMDGVFEVVHPGQSFTYEFTAKPAGLQLYHCHAIPLKRHISKGLYGTFIIDPKEPRPAAREMVMVMNGFDTNFDGENEIYAVNTVPFAYHHDPIIVKKGELQRIYMVNILEFDLINSMHLHGNFFNVFRTGSVTSSDFTDTLMFCQGERHILEFTYDETGLFMFHAHQSEFAELGWMGVFKVVDDVVPA